MRTLSASLLAAAATLAALPSIAAAAPACGTENLLAGKKPSASQGVKGDLGQVTDGIAAPEGTQWDAPVTVTLEGPTSSITYDLGEVRSVSGIVMQADANDTYKVMGSVDGSPTSFKLLVELPNVVNTGHGLRTRSNEIPPTEVRYLRVGDANGDNYFSISEFAAYCKRPASPGMKIVDVPPPAAADSQAPPKPGSDTGRWALLLTAVALALAWLAYKTITRPATEASDSDDAAAGAKPGESASDKPGEPPPGDKPPTV